MAAARPFAYGEGILREAPLLFVPQDAAAFLKASGTEAMLAIAQRLGDASRLAAFAAFCQLPEPQRQELMAMEASQGCTLVGDTKRIIGRFLGDFPQFASAIDWERFCHVVGIFSDRGSRLPAGGRALYRLSSYAGHSCTPNAVVETLSEGGMREVRAIAYRGISENEAIAVSFLEEDALLLPLQGRRDALKGMGRSWTQCSREDSAGDPLALLQSVSKASKDMGEASLRKCLQDLHALDALLPFALVGKARVRAKLGQACEACEGEALLKEAAVLYEASIDETHIVLGQKGLRNANNVRKRLEELQDRIA